MRRLPIPRLRIGRPTGRTNVTHHQTRRPPHRGEAGFSLIESVIALAVIFVVLVGLLSAFTAGAKGVITGRQRSAALALANELMEKARGRGYGEVGHDLDSDPTLATDPLIVLSGTPLTRHYTGVSPPEPLAASTMDAGANGGATTNPLFPFSPHRWTAVRDATTFTTTVYVTRVTPATGDPYKRMSVLVTWTPSQYATAAQSVELSTFIYNLQPPPDPRLIGEAEADAGSFVVTGTITGTGFSGLRLTLPYASGAVDSGFIRTAKGFSQSARSEVTVTSGTPSVTGTGCAAGTLRADCPGIKAETGADNDTGTAPPDRDHSGPLSTLGGSITLGSALSAILGGGTTESVATGRSESSTPDDNDALPFQWARATGPGATTVGFKAGPADGVLMSSPAGCAANCAVATVDRDDVSGSARLASTATTTYPAVDLATFPSVSGYFGMVRIAPATVTATAHSGPGATSPATSGSGSVAVQLYNPGAPGSYDTVTITPGTGFSTTTPTRVITVGGATVTMTASVRANPAVASSTTLSGALTQAKSSLTSWLSVTITLVVEFGSKVADLTLDLDYGGVSASASYEAT